jgi:HAD superfamily hydrolase (TIGR01549 family)
MRSVHWWTEIVIKILNENSKFKKEALLPQKIAREIGLETFKEFSRPECWKKYDGCDNLLENLRAKGLKLGVISNFDERLFEIVENLGIEKCFDFIITPSNTNGLYKPQKEIFNRALELSKVNREQDDILHIGDHYDLDYTAAKNANFKSLLLLHGKSSKSDLEPKIRQVVESGECAFDFNELKEKILLN